MHINQHLSFHVTVNVSEPPLPRASSSFPLASLPPLLSFPHSVVASA